MVKASQERAGVYSESEKEYNRALSKRIAEATAGVTSAELARRLGVHEQSVYRWLRRDYVPSAVNIAKLCREFGLDANELLGVRGDG